MAHFMRSTISGRWLTERRK